MKESEVRQVKARAQSLETKIEQLFNDAHLLNSNGVDTSTSDDLRERQEEVQDEMELMVADLLAILAESDNVSPESIDGEYELPGIRRRPVEHASLPEPRVGNGKYWKKNTSDNGKGN
jgi:predicted nuclease with TOPRIM domain